MTYLEAWTFMNSLVSKGHELELDCMGNSYTAKCFRREGYGNTMLHAVEDLRDKMEESIRDQVFKTLVS